MRWIVSPRSDGKNVDNWHWTERDLFEWCKSEFETRFKNLKIPSEIAKLEITKADSVKGSMIVCNRKGKTLYIYDVQLKLNWEGSINSESETDSITAKGTISVHDISNDEDKIRINIKADDESVQKQIIIEDLKRNVKPVIEKIVGNLIEEMKGIKAPKEDSSSVPVRQAVCKILFTADPQQIFQALAQPGSLPHLSEIQSYFDLFESKVQGQQVEVQSHSKIVHKWRLNHWPQSHYSKASINLVHDEGSKGTHLTLTHSEIPSAHYDTTLLEWEKFWSTFSNLFGYTYTTFQWS